VLSFASLSAASFTITLDNWTGTAYTQGGGGTDRLIFDSDQSGNLSSFTFSGYAPGAMEFALGGGYFEIVAIPEARTFVPGLLAVLVLLARAPVLSRGLAKLKKRKSLVA
jgi:hypothetical protein